MRKYTREQLLFFLKEHYSRNKKSPTVKNINKNKRYPSATTYESRFGSWNNALKAAGLKVNSRSFDKKELIENVKQLAKELGRIPKAKDLKSREWCASGSTYRKYFGSWKKALAEAGLKKKAQEKNLKDFLRKKH